MEFLIIYIKERHPAEPGKEGKSGKTGGIPMTQPKTYDERKGNATTCRADLKLELPFLIDDMDNAVSKTYSGDPDRIYIITKEGNIHYKGEPGPTGFKSDEAEASLKKLLSM